MSRKQTWTYGGTSHFISLGWAIKYYKSQGYAHRGLKALVKEKISEGLISVGMPVIPKGCLLSTNTEEGRYFIKYPA